MKRFAAICATAAFALLITGCSSEPDLRDADVKALKDNEAQWNQDYVAKDIDKVMGHYADDAVLMTPGAPSVTGKDPIKKALKDLISDPAFTLKFTAAKVEAARSGDVGYTQGSYTMTVTDPNTKQPITDHGSYITTYRKEPNGTWKAVADIATSEVPPPAPAPPADAKKDAKKK